MSCTEPSALILVLEDEAVVAMHLEARLVHLGYRVLGPVATSSSARELAERERPDLVLADIRLRGESDGIAAATALRHELGIPTVYLSAYADAETLQRAMAADPFGYLTKPVRESELHATIKTALHRSRLERALATRERELSASEARFRAVFQGSPDALLVVDRAGTIRMANAAADALFGYAAEELLNMKVEQLVPVSARDRHLGLRLAFSEKRQMRIMGSSGVVYGLTKQGVEIPLEIGLNQAPLAEGECVVVAVRDISERIRRQDEIRRLATVVHQSQKLDAIGRLASGIAHDFNNLLTVILGAGRLLERHLQDERVLQLARDIGEAGNRAKDLIEQLLTFARQKPVEPRIVDINAQISGFAGLLSRSLGRQVELDLNLGTGPFPVRIDPLQLDRVLLNLGVNARDAMPDGGRLIIRTARATENHKRNGFVIEVEDQGVGMSEEIQAQIFEPFFTTRPFGEGTGLGLSTVYGIVKQLDGEVTVRSCQGQGTVFRIWLPGHEGGHDLTLPLNELTGTVEKSSMATLPCEEEKGV